ncbi:MAG: hypothetical protein DLM69_07040 [Candidatus Chloroheliales bacterium]|nr:MAG: hypothetical protein DLM69_07040 [Chloroflexota bacterium]
MFDASITLLQVVGKAPLVLSSPLESPASIGIAYKMIEDKLVEADRYLGEVADQLRVSGVHNVATRVARGEAAANIVALADAGYDLVVMSTHGRSGLVRTLLGSVAEQVVREAGLPVLLVSSHQQMSEGVGGALSFDRILVPLDGSGFAEQTLPLAVAIAKASGGRLLLLKVVEEVPPLPPYTLVPGHPIYANSYLKRLVRGETLERVPCEVIGFEGDPATTILAAQEARNCSLIVMTTHGRTGLVRFIRGSVAEEVIKGSAVPVLVLCGRPVEAEPVYQGATASAV